MVLLVAHQVPTFLSLPVLSTKLTSHSYLSLAAITEPLATSNTTLHPHLPIKSGMAQGQRPALSSSNPGPRFSFWLAMEGSLSRKDKLGSGELPYLLQQQNRARLQLILVCLQKHSVHCSKHLSCKSHKVKPSPGQGSESLSGKWDVHL